MYVLECLGDRGPFNMWVYIFYLFTLSAPTLVLFWGVPWR